ncbi:HAD-IIA family hydrolase [Glycomyces sp. NPDC048151]|uniref:HAD-IIA family hydrolase n=1 Tax=Glycomyces sp. NPDC048151 TaxID=3364002 RepID=UPI003715EEBF
MTRLKGTAAPLASAYDQALLDLDGVVYLLHNAIPESAPTITALPGFGCEPVFVTNNASRSTEVVAESMRGMGIPAEASQVITTGQVLAAELVSRLGKGGKVFVHGSPALRAVVAEAGLEPVEDPKAAAGVAFGLFPEATWRLLADATIAVRNGAYWAVANLDATLPTSDGPLPGMGAMVQAVATALGHGPHFTAGKPEQAIYQAALARKPGGRAIMVGDRPDSDIEGANRAGLDSLLVFTGVASPRMALTLPPEQRPTYLGWSLGALTETHAEPQWVEDGEAVQCGGWSVKLEQGSLLLGGSGDPLDAWRAMCEFSWHHNGMPFPLVGSGDAAQKVLAD